jgi:hypothetical protein
MAEDPEWRPWGMDWDNQELEMVKFIHQNLITPGRLFGDSDFKLLATQRCAEHVLTADPEEDFDQFNEFVCSPRFSMEFQRKHCLCLRNP